VRATLIVPPARPRPSAHETDEVERPQAVIAVLSASMPRACIRSANVFAVLRNRFCTAATSLRRRVSSGISILPEIDSGRAICGCEPLRADQRRLGTRSARSERLVRVEEHVLGNVGVKMTAPPCTVQPGVEKSSSMK
jgi:hypothetical protein